jgi:AmiR/NasT family two-component response regulator
MTAVADFIATYVSIGLDTVRKLTNMSAAGDSKASIGVATGVLMERFGLTEVQAFAVLRRHSQDQQKKLRDVADELLATGNLPGPDPTQRRAGWTADS